MAAAATAWVARRGRQAVAGTRCLQTHAIRPSVAPGPDLLDPATVPQSPLRSSTAAVAGRLFQQESCCLLPDTPTTLHGALEESKQARIITEASPPYRITHANRAWEQLCGYDAGEVLAQGGLGFLQGAGTDRKAVERVNAAVREAARVRVTLLNYTKHGEPFFNHLQISPLRSPLGQVTHLLGVLTRADAL